MSRMQNWNIKKANNDSGSESAPLLSSGSHTSIEPVIFNDSETSDLDNSPTSTCIRYGSIGPNKSLYVSTIVPKRLPPLTQESILAKSPPSSPLLITQEQCYEIRNIDLILENESFEKRPLKNPFAENLDGPCFGKFPKEEIQLPIKDTKSKQSSIVTIFSIWNTILGSSLLTLPWGIGMAGFFPGIILVMAMSGLCLYTAYCLLSVHRYHGEHHGVEVIQLCRTYLNKWAEYTAQIFSITVLLGATIAYWVLMSNFLYNSVNFIYDDIVGTFQFVSETNNTEVAPEVLCPKMVIYNNMTAVTAKSLGPLEPVWNLYRTVPVFLGVLIFPLLNFKSPTFFTKFNALGTISVLYLIIFVIVKSATWGLHMTANDWDHSWNWKTTFPALSGMLALSFFIHNIIISIMQNNRDQSKNGRDLTIAYILVTVTYVTIGVIFYICFPLAKTCIEDNFLNNFQKWDGLTVAARVLLLFQLLTVYPLLAYMLRYQLLSSVCKAFSKGWIILVNMVLVSICILFATFVPYIGTIIRYTGALSGFVYVFTLPSFLYLAIMRKQGRLRWYSLLLHICIPIIGIANLLAQFFITDH